MLIEFQNVEKRYAKRNILSDISFRITPVEVKDINEMFKEIKIKIKNPTELRKAVQKVSKLSEKNPNI